VTGEKKKRTGNSTWETTLDQTKKKEEKGGLAKRERGHIGKGTNVNGKKK